MPSALIPTTGGVCDVCRRLEESTSLYTGEPWHRCDSCAERLHQQAQQRARARRYLRAMSPVYARQVGGSRVRGVA